MMDAHYDALRKAVAGALKHNYYSTERYKFGSMLSMVPESALFPDGIPKVPKVYELYRKCMTWNTLWWTGNMANQPHILMTEFEMCRLGESDFRDWLRQLEESQQGGTHLPDSEMPGLSFPFPKT